VNRFHRKVVFVSKGRGAENIAGFVQHLRAHNGAPDNIAAACIDMSPAFIKGVTDHLPKAKITFDKFHVVAHASQAVDQMRRTEQKTDPALKGLRWALLKDKSKLSPDQARDLDRLVVQFTTKRTARAWLYREQLRDILDRRQFNIVSAMLALVRQRHALQGRQSPRPHHPGDAVGHRRRGHSMKRRTFIAGLGSCGDVAAGGAGTAASSAGDRIVANRSPLHLELHGISPRAQRCGLPGGPEPGDRVSLGGQRSGSLAGTCRRSGPPPGARDRGFRRRTCGPRGQSCDQYNSDRFWFWGPIQFNKVWSPASINPVATSLE
jgi:hypothetical protein